MEKNEKTKYKLAEAMKECMKTSKVDAITVKQLAEKCGLTRQTFYRNFLDKFDLINWYFGKILDQSFEHMGRETSVYDALVRKFTYIEQEKQFFAAAFCYDEQNSLREHDFALSAGLNRRIPIGPEAGRRSRFRADVFIVKNLSPNCY